MHNHRPLVLDPSATAAYHVTNQIGVELIGENMCLTPRIAIFRPGKFLASARDKVILPVHVVRRGRDAPRLNPAYLQSSSLPCLVATAPPMARTWNDYFWHFSGLTASSNVRFARLPEAAILRRSVFEPSRTIVGNQIASYECLPMPHVG